MPRRLLKIQVLILAIGVIFSWATLVFDYQRFFDAGGKVFQFSQCIVANPLATPCFYGAIAFLVAFIWSVIVLRSKGLAIRRREQGLCWLLLAGTLFAWGNFGYELSSYVPAFSCPPVGAPANPFLAPCFYGAMIYSLAFAISGWILYRTGK